MARDFNGSLPERGKLHGRHRGKGAGPTIVEEQRKSHPQDHREARGVPLLVVAVETTSL